MMAHRTEADLVRELDAAAERAPRPSGNLAATVRARRRRRGGRRMGSGLAAVAVITVIGAGTALARGSVDPVDVAASVSTPAAVKPDVSVSSPATALWPTAVRTVPAETSDGLRYRPVTGLGGTEILMIAESPVDPLSDPFLMRRDRLEVYDIVAGKAWLLAELLAATGDYHIEDVEVGPDRIGWFGETLSKKGKRTDFWVVPRAGGTPVRVGVVTGALAEVDRMVITRDHVVWSVDAGGIYRMPITGGPAERLPDTDGLHLQVWPWASDVRRYAKLEANQSLLVNLETGERVTPRAGAGVKRLRCGPEWCVGSDDDGGLVQRLDGSQVRRIPGLPGHFIRFPYAGRFVGINGQAGPSMAVYDIATGKVGEVGAMVGKKFGMINTGASPLGSLLYWPAGNIPYPKECPTTGSTPPASCPVEESGKATEWEVLDLAAVPPAE